MDRPQTDDTAGGLLPTDPAVTQFPETFYRAARLAGRRVYAVPGTNLTIVIGYAEIKQALATPEIFSSDVRSSFGSAAAIDTVLFPSDVLIMADPPEHQKVRKLVARELSPTRITALEPFIQSTTDALLDAFIDRCEAEMFSDFAMPLPVLTIAKVIGIPAEDKLKIREWSDAVVHAFDVTASEEQQRESVALIREMNRYILDMIQERRQYPGSDILSALISAELIGDAPGEPIRKLSDIELLTLIQQLLVGGHENTTSAIMSALLLLIQNPVLMAELRAEPQKVKPFIEEMLRLEGPAQGVLRRVTRDTQLGGVHLRMGTTVILRYGSANLDDEQFPGAAQLDISRANIASHLGFGGGVHHCVGAQLARREMFCALTSVLRRLHNLRLHPKMGPIRYAPVFHGRALMSLLVRFDLPDLPNSRPN